ncbi:HAD family hydrolase [Pseudonocardia sp.]|uniref:HAD family hydrolase n=1 Tax=Pseudonocardia sp. TaxID=60912 RepID=UPI003D0ED2A3
MKLAEVLDDARHILLDFDGPVCAVYGGTSDRVVAEHLRGLISTSGWELSGDVKATSDPLEILRYSASLGATPLRLIEDEFTAREIEAVGAATPTPGLREALEALTDADRTVTIVSNNSERAIRAYLDRTCLRRHVAGVVGRIAYEPTRMKPRPDLLLAAVSERGAEPTSCVMIGDSVSDIEAAKAAGVPSIGYANRPVKRARLEAAAPSFVMDSMYEIAVAARQGLRG